jgi:hypothetical protein
MVGAFGLPSPSRDRDGIGRRDIAGIHCGRYSITEVSSLYSCFACQPALVRRDLDMQLFSLLINASLSITAS